MSDSIIHEYRGPGAAPADPSRWRYVRQDREATELSEADARAIYNAAVIESAEFAVAAGTSVVHYLQRWVPSSNHATGWWANIDRSEHGATQP